MRTTSPIARPCFWCGLPALKYGSAAALVADLLESDPEVEWTVNQIADRLDLRRNTVQVVLARLRDVEVVEWRWGTPKNGGQEGIWRWKGQTEGWRIVAVRA